MEQDSNSTAPFLLIQKPQDLIRLFENLIDQKIREVAAVKSPPAPPPIFPDSTSPFLSSKQIEEIFKVSRQTVNDWRKTGLLKSFKIKSRRFFFKEQVEQLRELLHAEK